MNDLLLPALIAAVAAIVVALIGARIGSIEQRLGALSRLEGKLDAVLKHHGIRFDPYGEEAKDHVDELRRRASPSV